ncbi:TFIIH subunit Tfb4-GTF2H3 [Babesia duncani]|uniref:TFIIH subunit Tfb4-GTF2H3 n=1 Tax=Babesia duncani TaxID=323732 RepID=A0AAD9UP39_9APIC|nr:TFIIH subunit Tfb4-GTF2H3 [Babesia duncani]
MQLCEITRGKHLHLGSILRAEHGAINVPQAVAQLLMFWLVPSKTSGQYLSGNLPFGYGNVSVCCCHFDTVQIAFLCPCCFAVYCRERNDSDRARIVCSTCGSRLMTQLLRQRTCSDADVSL